MDFFRNAKLRHSLRFYFNVFIICMTFLNAESTGKEDNEAIVLRCPLKANNTGVLLNSDKRLCNVFHECHCLDNVETTSSGQVTCGKVRSLICPLGTVFINSTRRCEPIELHGCDTSYLQWIHTIQSSRSGNSSSEYEFSKNANIKNKQQDFKLEAANISGVSDFACPPGSNERFADPRICNVFHVCVSRGEQTYDQPFLCPFSTVFRVLDSKTMFCDRRASEDCNNKAFYSNNPNEEDTSISMRDNSMLIEINNNSSNCGDNDEVVEDKIYCNTYHECNSHMDQHFMCDNNLLFNPLSLICDYPINVACFNKQIYRKQINSNLMQAQKAEPSQTVQSQSSQPQTPQVQTEAVHVSKSSIQLQNLMKTETRNETEFLIYGVKISLKCPMGAKNYLFPDPVYCNVFHHCHSYSGNVLVCEKDQAFDPNANGPEKSGVCNFENSVNCEGKLIITENAQRIGQPAKSTRISVLDLIKENIAKQQQNQQQLPQPQPQQLTNFLQFNKNSPQEISNAREELVSGVLFDCKGKTNGHWRDHRYCDVFHACISNEQRKTYSCAQIGERVYFDETSKRCEFAKNNPSGCSINFYFQQVIQPMVKSSLMSEESTEPWKIFIRSRESFSCFGRMDGFYASRWCNVFYRCFLGVKTEFLCPKMLNTDRLWWVQHSTSQETPQTSAACVWPCETKNKCMSPGGVIIENLDGSFSDSLIETERVWTSASCAESKSSNEIFHIQDSDFSCGGLSEGSFYPSKFCNVFHRCAGGKRRDFRCAKATNSPYDLWWNEAANQCEWPCRVKCEKPVYGTQKPSSEIQSEDYSLNEDECRLAQTNQQPKTPLIQQTTYATNIVSSKQIQKPFPDERFICPGIGLFISFRYCNVYYECEAFGLPPNSAYYCLDGGFDPLAKICRMDQICTYNPALYYPYVSIPEPIAPEEVACSSTIGYYIIHSTRYCNIYYICDGRSVKPSTYLCYDRKNLEDAVFNRDTRKCETRLNGGCSNGEILLIKLRYQSTPVDHNRLLPDLQPLSCRADQQYLAEHDKYCNLYHSCILGKYQMYACVTIGSYDKTSFFYYTSGDCAAPNSAQCGPNKAIYPYEKLFPVDYSFIQTSARFASVKSTNNFNPVSVSFNASPTPVCETNNNYLIAHPKYCNLFYECNKGKLLTFACVDSSNGKFSGIFDSAANSCKPFNLVDCPSKSLYNPEETKLDTKPKLSDLFQTEANFSCINRKNGYYESEWCNVFFRCVNGKRIDARCSSGTKLNRYDLWWEHQSATYDQSSPILFDGSDGNAKCEWPCKVKCNKPIWTAAGSEQLARLIQEKDLEANPECAANNKTAVGLDLEDSNPSGFSCDEREGIFQDPLFCNIYHDCLNKERRTFICTFNTKESDALFDSERKQCIQKKGESLAKCNGIIYEYKFLYVPAYKNLPASSEEQCYESGIFRAQDGQTKYCDLYYWCDSSMARPVYFYCDAAFYTNDYTQFNIERKRCELRKSLDCPGKMSRVYMDSLKIGNDLNEERKLEMEDGKKELVAGHQSLDAIGLFKNFQCPLNSAGFYPDPQFCDVFHYCFSNGQHHTFACDSVSDSYQLWWNYPKNQTRQNKINCEWPCSMAEENSPGCPASKKILIQNKQIVASGVPRQTVLASVCQGFKDAMPINLMRNLASLKANSTVQLN